MGIKKIILLFIVGNILLASIAIPIENSVHTNIETNSIILSEGFNLIHLQIDSNEVREVWRVPYVVDGYDQTIVEDLDGDGELDIIAVVNNREIQRIEFETGEILWSFNLPSINSGHRGLQVGDINGDGKIEIIYSRTASVYDGVADTAISVIDVDGKLIQYIPSPSSIKIGADNIILEDIDDDGMEELVISYGAILWNATSKTGQYNVQLWDWDDSNNILTKSWENNGIDTGGNTELCVYGTGRDSVIITSGWYNNPVRAFDIDGNKLWETKINDTDSFMQLSQYTLDIHEDGEGNPHLLVSTNNYWLNYTLTVNNLDLYTGEKSTTPISVVNSTRLISKAIGDYLFTYSYGILPETGYQISTPSMNVYDIDTFEFVGSLRTDTNSSWADIPLNRGNFITTSIVDDSPGVMVNDEYGRTWISTLEGNVMISPLPFGKIYDAQFIEMDKYHGTTLNSYPQYGLILIFSIILLNILALMTLFSYKYYHDVKFDKQFSIDWKFLAYKRLRGIFLRLGLIDGIQKSTPSLTSGEVEEDSVSVAEIYEEMQDIAPTANTIQFNNFVNDWMNDYGEEIKKIKIGDIAVLIEFLDLVKSTGPQSIQDVSDRFPDSPKSTVYRRVNSLIKMGLLKESPTDEFDADLRQKLVEISDYGIEFLKTIFSSLSFYFIL